MSNSNPHKPSFGRTLLKLILGLCVLTLALVCLAPVFFSTRMGTDLITRQLNQRFQGEVKIDSLSLSLFGGQTIKHVHVYDHQKQLIGECPLIETDQSLLALLVTKDIGHARMQAPHLIIRNSLPTFAAVASLPVMIGGFAALPEITSIQTDVTGHLVVTDGRIEVLAQEIDPILFKELNLELDLPPSREQIALKLNCTTEQNTQMGTVAIVAHISDLNSPTPQVSIDSTINQLPVQGVDQIVGYFRPSLRGILYLALGPTLNFHLTAQSAGPQHAFNLTWEMDTAHLVGSAQVQMTENQLTLTSPSVATFTLTPQLMKRLNEEIVLSKPAQFQLKLDTLAGSSFSGSFFNAQPLSLLVKAQPLELNMVRFELNSPDALNEVHFKGSIQSPSQGSLELQGAISQLQTTALTQATLTGVKVSVDLMGALVGASAPLSHQLGDTADLHIALKAQGEEKSAQIAATTPLLQIGPMEVTINEKIQLEQPAPFAYTLKAYDNQVLKGSIQGALTPLKKGMFKVKGALDIPEFILQQVTLTQGSIPFELNTATQTASIQVNAQVKDAASSDGTLAAQIRVTELPASFDVTLAKTEASLTLQNLSTTFLDLLIEEPISPWIGPSMQAKVDFVFSPKEQSFTIKGSSPYMTCALGLNADTNGLKLKNSPAEISWVLTPERYQILDKLLTGGANSPFELHAPTTFQFLLSQLQIPFSLESEGQKMFEFGQSLINASGKAGTLEFFDRSSQEKIQLSECVFNFNRSSLKAPMRMSLTSSVASQGGKIGSINLDATLDLKGNDLTSLTSDIQLKVVQFPSRVFDLLARTQGAVNFPFSLLFGETLNATLSAQLKEFSGPIALSVQSPQTRISLKGKLANGALMLTEPLHAQAALTPETSRLLLGKANPLSITYLYSRNPITLEISPKDFYLPLYPFDVSRIHLGAGKLELGKIHCHNEGNLNAALSILKSKQFNKAQDLVLWFAPLDFHMTQGKIDIERTEILLSDTFDIALWGKIDVAGDYVDMVLGLTAPTLRLAFGIKELPDNYVLTIPLKGPMNNVKMDTKKATAKVTMILAWQKATEVGGAAAGPAGALLGGLVNKMATLPDSDGKVPPPKHPFPWEIGRRSKESSSTEPSGKKRHFKQKERPFKQILKVIR